MQDIRIYSGHDGLIQEMLQEIGWGNLAVKQWHIEHFISDYLTGSWNLDQGIDDWSSHWEITVTFEQEIPHADLLMYKHVPSWAREHAKGYGEEEPWWRDNCMMVANFYTQQDLEVAKQLLLYVEELRVGKTNFATLKSDLGWDVARKLLGFNFALKENRLTQPLSFRPRYLDSWQLFIYLGKYDKVYYQSDMQLGEDKPVPIPQRLITLISSLNGTILQFDHQNRLEGLVH